MRDDTSVDDLLDLFIAPVGQVGHGPTGVGYEEKNILPSIKNSREKNR